MVWRLFKLGGFLIKETFKKTELYEAYKEGYKEEMNKGKYDINNQLNRSNHLLESRYMKNNNIEGKDITPKQLQYNQLVSLRKSCDVCKGLKNPSQVEKGSFDSTEIGPWTTWQGNLDSRLMLIAQDWGHVGNFIRLRGTDINSETNKTLKRLFEIADLELTMPLSEIRKNLYFFTNAILCLKEGNDQAPVKREWYCNCGPRFLKPLIEIIKPKVIICLGEKAYNTTMSSYSILPGLFRSAVDRHIPVMLNNSIAVFAVYHCGRRIRNTHRNELQQENDWRHIGKWIRDNYGGLDGKKL